MTGAPEGVVVSRVDSRGQALFFDSWASIGAAPSSWAPIGRVSDAGVLVLETDGTFSAVGQEALGLATGPRSAATVVPEP